MAVAVAVAMAVAVAVDAIVHKRRIDMRMLLCKQQTRQAIANTPASNRTPRCLLRARTCLPLQAGHRAAHRHAQGNALALVVKL